MNICATRSSLYLVPSPDGPDPTLHNQNLSFHIMFNHESPGQVGSIEHEPFYSLDLRGSLLGREGPPLSPTSLAQSSLAAFITDVKSPLHPDNYIGRIGVK